MIPPALPQRKYESNPPSSEPAKPNATVPRKPIGSGPGTAHLAIAPTTKLERIRARMKMINIGPGPYRIATCAVTCPAPPSADRSADITHQDVTTIMGLLV